MYLHFAVIKQHTIHFFNSSFCSFLCLKMYESITLGSIFVTYHLLKKIFAVIAMECFLHVFPPPTKCQTGKCTQNFALTLQERMFPKAENVSYNALLSIDLSKFLMKMFPTPLLRRDGSRWDHMMRTGLPLMTSKFMVSKARSAGKKHHGVSRKHWSCFRKSKTSILSTVLQIILAKSSIITTKMQIQTSNANNHPSSLQVKTSENSSAKAVLKKQEGAGVRWISSRETPVAPVTVPHHEKMAPGHDKVYQLTAVMTPFPRRKGFNIWKKSSWP